jgi:hypothetical protein
VFHIELATGEAGWSLSLVPRDPQLLRIVSRLSIAGRDAEVATVETLRADGDRSLMRITPQAPP